MQCSAVQCSAGDLKIAKHSTGIQNISARPLSFSLSLSLSNHVCCAGQVLKELSTKRIGFDKAAFVQTSADLLPVLCQAWDAQWAVIEALLPLVAAGTVPSADDESEAGTKAAEAMSLGTVIVKVGWSHVVDSGSLDPAPIRSRRLVA